ncbi:FYR N-terminal domain-containing protein [Balamuthia mandrillaris]
MPRKKRGGGASRSGKGGSAARGGSNVSKAADASSSTSSQGTRLGPRRGGGPPRRAGDPRGSAAIAFGCGYHQVNPFDRGDPYNPGNTLVGFICRKEGPFVGSLYITQVNYEKLDEPQVIYATPKLLYPYRKEEDHVYKNFAVSVAASMSHSYDGEEEEEEEKEKEKDTDEANGQPSSVLTSFFLSNKWNGTNVLVYKYTDREGQVYVSLKSKGSPFLTNGHYGNFEDQVRKAPELKRRPSQKSFKPTSKTFLPFDDTLPECLQPLLDTSVQSISFELCGDLLPHLVKYNFAIAMKPLFVIYTDGSISPYQVAADGPTSGEKDDECYGPEQFEQERVVKICQTFQERDFEANEKFRADKGLPHRYEYNHFIKEGRVLYLLDERGRVPKRKLYKVKPRDIEEVHWSTFDETMQGRVDEAIQKILQREKTLTKEALMEELDMGPKEWSRFGGQVWKYVEQLKRQDALPSKRS